MPHPAPMTVANSAAIALINIGRNAFGL
jgi:hypothetical protein